MQQKYVRIAAVAVGLALALPCSAVVPVVKTVPWVATDPSVPHDTYTGKAAILKGTTNVAGNFTATWSFGDGTPNAVISPVTAANQYALEASHAYPAGDPIGTIYTATLTVVDNTTSESASATYKVAKRASDLTSNVNVSIDDGLWYLHKTMQRYTSGVTLQGDWDNLAPTGCPGGQQACDNQNNETAINASNVLAFEVNGHFENGAASNPYTETVARAMARLFTHLVASAIPVTKTISFAAPPSCPAPGNPGCTFNPDGNGNALAVYPGGPNTGHAFYQGGQFIDAIVASGTPAAVTTTGPAGVIGRTYKEIVQDMVDGYNYCQYPFSPGGGWYYSCQGYDDNSVSQWAGIGLIGAQRSFGINIPQIVLDANKVWMTNSQNAAGQFGYTDTNPLWGPYATTPSGMVQLAMDGVGRGDARWDKAETVMRNGFNNSVAGCGGNPSCAATTNPKNYTYGLFSFTKSMLLHSPGGVLTPITMLQSQTPGVPPIDWYAAEVSQGAPTDGVARTLVNRQNPAGYWTGNSYYTGHYPFETGWSIIMLRRTVFVACVTNLSGRGTASGAAAARVDLTWSGIANVDHYDVFRGTVNGGPYVKIGTTTTNVYSDRTGLANNGTYYYVIQPINAAGSEICQSNQATIKVPAGR
jgi:hypothetical protein